MDKHDEYEKAYKNRPHVVILGAGASLATILAGDKNGKKISVMDGFLDNLGMTDIIKGLNLTTNSKNLEDIYSEIAEDNKYKEVREELDNRIRSYFQDFEIPDTPTIYDFLLLSLREKDLIATFNWDPLLLQAYNRVSMITKKLPQLAFLHGNVLIGYCEKHKTGGNLNNICPVCIKSFTASRLLYPINKKNYNQDYYTLYNWKTLKNFLKIAYQVTIFGYSAPKTDVEAIDMLKDAWGDKRKRNMEDFEFIDIAEEDALIETWQKFVHTHHYTYINDFFNSTLAMFPRRTMDALFDRTQNCYFFEPTNRFTKEMSFQDLNKIVKNLRLEEEKYKDSFISFKKLY